VVNCSSMASRFKSGCVLVALLVVAWASPFSAQMLGNSRQTSTPEHHKMDCFAGHWNLQGTMKISRNTPSCAIHGHGARWMVEEWILLETHSSITSVVGDTSKRPRDGVQRWRQGLYVQRLQQSGWALDVNRLRYTRRGPGALKWRWTASLRNAAIRSRWVLPPSTPSGYETRTEPDTWNIVIEGKATKFSEAAVNAMSAGPGLRDPVGIAMAHSGTGGRNVSIPLPSGAASQIRYSSACEAGSFFCCFRGHSNVKT